MCVLFICYWIPAEWQDGSYFSIQSRHTGSWPLDKDGLEGPGEMAQSVKCLASMRIHVPSPVPMLKSVIPGSGEAETGGFLA